MTFDRNEPLPDINGRPYAYRLDGQHNPVPMKTHGEQREWFSQGYGSKEKFDAQNRVAETHIDGDCWVSTVFLSIDHSYTSDGPPILFETLVFGGDLDGEMERYATWGEAVVGHEAMVRRLMGKGVG